MKRFLVIACEILFREVCFCASLCGNVTDLKFMGKALHDIGSAGMSKQLQTEIDSANSDIYDAILLIYALCNNGISGLRSKIPMVVPRAHDCITLLMGSKEKYKMYHEKNPSAYYMSPGWIERDDFSKITNTGIPSQLWMNRTYQEYADQYGEENAVYLMEALGDWTSNYSKYTFIDTKTGDVEKYINDTKALANEKGWEFEKVEGSKSLIMDMMNGKWDDERFLVLPAGKPIESSYDGCIIRAGK